MFSFLKYKPSCGIAGPYGNSMFNHLRNCHNVLSTLFLSISFPVILKYLKADFRPQNISLVNISVEIFNR